MSLMPLCGAAVMMKSARSVAEVEILPALAVLTPHFLMLSQIHESLALPFHGMVLF